MVHASSIANFPRVFPGFRVCLPIQPIMSTTHISMIGLYTVKPKEHVLRFLIEFCSFSSCFWAFDNQKINKLCVTLTQVIKDTCEEYF